MSAEVIIGVVQFAPMHKEVEANLLFMADTISSSNADLLIFPELSLSGYAFASTEEAYPFSQAHNSKEIVALCDAAKVAKTAVVFGYIERDGETLYNSALCINAHGEVVGNYRKVHLFYYEKSVFASGNLGFPVFAVSLKDSEVKVGIQICYDWRFPESTRSLALQGAQIVAIPSNIVTMTGMLEPTLRVRAFENKVIVAFADRIGSEVLIGDSEESLQFRGNSMIVNYNGEILSSLSDSESSIATTTISPEKTLSKEINNLNNIFLDSNKNQYFA